MLRGGIGIDTCVSSQLSHIKYSVIPTRQLKVLRRISRCHWSRGGLRGLDTIGIPVAGVRLGRRIVGAGLHHGLLIRGIVLHRSGSGRMGIRGPRGDVGAPVHVHVGWIIHDERHSIE